MSSSVHNKKQIPGTSTQVYLQIAEIRDDTAVLKNGGLRVVLKTSSINFNLKSEAEQKALIYSYQSFLNSLEFPLQIVVRSKKLDIDYYLQNLKKIGIQQTNQLLQKQTYEYIEYIEKLIEYADIMEKEFFVIVPQDPYRAQKLNIFAKFWQHIHPQDSVVKIRQRHHEFDELKKNLMQKVNIVKSGLINCGLAVDQLKTKDLIELFYISYNPILARQQKLQDLSKLNIETDAVKNETWKTPIPQESK